MTMNEMSLDELNELDPADLTAKHIDQLILFYRKQRVYSEAGIRPKKEKAPTKDIGKALGDMLVAPPAPKGSSGLRRI